MRAPTVLLLSIRPKYADLVFAGTKTVELRRVKPRVEQGDKVAVYVSSPVKELKGICTVEQVIVGPPEELWQQVSLLAGVSRDEFCSYFEGANNGYAIVFAEVRTLDDPVGLTKLREEFGAFHPPQIYQYLTGDLAASILQWPASARAASNIGAV